MRKESYWDPDPLILNIGFGFFSEIHYVERQPLDVDAASRPVSPPRNDGGNRESAAFINIGDILEAKQKSRLGELQRVFEPRAEGAHSELTQPVCR
jgi:hypothetical protein